MDGIRILLATSCFFAGLYLGYELVFGGFHWGLLLACGGAFAVAHLLLPQDEHRRDSPWLDWLEAIVDLPFRIASALVKLAVRLTRGDGPDLDL